MKTNKNSIIITVFFIMSCISAFSFLGCEGEVIDDGSDLTGEAHFYFGSLHSHTGFSDGEGTPEEALIWARDSAGYDFYAITDHGEMTTNSEWDEVGTAVDAFDEDGVFTAIRGFEYSQPLAGHINVFNTPDETSAILLPILTSFYNWLDDHTGLGQFNHPGELGDHRDLEYYDYISDNMFAIETGNGGGGNNSGEYLGFYTIALDLGWRVAPTNNQDNHSLNTNCHRTVIVSEFLSRDRLYDAMRSRRIYSTDDPNMEITFKAGNKWMGSEIIVQSGSMIAFETKINDDEPILKLELITQGGEVAAEYSPGENNGQISWNPSVTITQDAYYFLKVTESNQLDNDDVLQIAVTAPIWVIAQ